MSDTLAKNLSHPKLAELFESQEDGKVHIKYGFNTGGAENHIVLATKDSGSLGIQTVLDLLNEGEVDFTDEFDPQWCIVGYMVYEEGAPIIDDHTGKELASLYGDPDSPDSED